MIETGQTAGILRERFIDNPYKLVKAMHFSGWLHAWDPNRFSLPVERPDLPFYYSAPDLSSEDLSLLAYFMAEHFHETDPTDDKIYTPSLCKWFCAGNHMAISDLDKVKAVLQEYDYFRSNFPVFASDPYRLYNTLTRKKLGRGRVTIIGRRAIKADPIQAALNIGELQKFIESTKLRIKRAEAYTQEKLPDDVPVDDIIEYNQSFCLYHHEKSCKGHRIFILDLPNGLRYQIIPHRGGGSRDKNTIFHMSDLDHNSCMLEKLVQDIPDVAYALAPFIEEEYDPSIILKFAHLLRFARLPSPLKEGIIARAFKDGFSDERGLSVSSFFYSLFKYLNTITHFKEEAALLEPEFISTLIRQASQAGALGTVRRCLPVINNKSNWRVQLSTEDITPIFEAVSSSPDDREYLADFLSFIATTPYWRDGSEAEYLPESISCILKHKDWAKLKRILLCASHPDDPVSAIWRKTITPVIRSDMRNVFKDDNRYKHFSLHLLVQRLDDLDKADAEPASSGKRKVVRLREMSERTVARSAFEEGHAHYPDILYA